MLLSLSHLLRASTTRMYGDWLPFSFNLESGRRTSCRHWSRRDWLAMLRRSKRASYICWPRDGTLLASCHTMLVTNLPVPPISPPPREKKKLAPSRAFLRYLRATMRAIVDFPVPARPFSQKMQRSSCPLAQLYISLRRSTRVSGRQVGSCCC